MTVWKKDGDFERAQKVEKTAPTRKAKKSSRKNLRPGTAAEVQSLLTGLGYDPGPADGVIGPLGRKAIGRYQAAAGLTADGEVTPELLTSLREAFAARPSQQAEPEPTPVAQSMRTEIGEDGVMREIAESEAVSEPVPIDLVIGAGIQPTEADIVFTSTDNEGRPGKLTQAVFSPLGLRPEDFPLASEDLKRGFATVFVDVPEGVRGFVFVVTVSDEGRSTALLRSNLHLALVEAGPDDWVKGKVLWLPLMGTGAGGLSLEDSLVLTIEAIADSRDLREHPPRRIFVAAPSSTSEERLKGLADLAAGVLDKSRFSRHFRLRTVTDADAAAAGPELSAVLTAARPYFDNDQTPKEDALNVRVQAAIFAKLIAAREVALPLSIGLFGNWGSGKTYFMNLIRDEITALAAGEDPKDETSTYMRRIAQIEFNAWHYVDTNLWASLAIRIFDGLAAQFPRREGDTTADLRARLRADMESSTEAKTEAEKKQLEAQKEREKAANALEKLRADRREQNKAYDALRFGRLLASNAMQRENLERIKEIAADFGLSKEVQTVEDAARLAEQMRALNGQGRAVMQAVSQQFSDWRSASIAVAVIVAFIAAFIGVSVAFPDTSVYVGEVIAAISAAVAWAGNRLARISKGVGLLDSLRAGFAALKADEGETDEERRLREQIETSDARIQTAESQIAEADRRIAEAQAELQRINAGGLVYDFLEARGADPEYKKELGVISTIRSDFNGLKELLEDWNKNYEAGSALPPIERIVLYIDDLDRCHPDKVVEVLQAVHLLLAFDLFVVIVAVDPRWLERSLYRAYVPELAERNLNGMEAQHLREFSPQNYLEKIFQIPFSLAGMSSDGYVRLINDLVVTRSEFQARREKRAPAAAPTDEGGESAGRTAETVEPVTPAEPHRSTDAANVADDIARDVSAEADASADLREEATPSRSSSEEEVLFNDWEQAFLQALHPFVSTPRLAKRMINIYRLIRVHALETAWQDTFFAPDGDYRAVLVLLALNIGHPRVGGPLLRLLRSGRQTENLSRLLPYSDRERAKQLGYDEAAAQEIINVRDHLDLVDEALREWSRANPSAHVLARPDDIEIYARWAPEVGRFSFHWNLE